MDGIIVVNKEKGMTSHDVVNIARKSLHTKKVGHAGTLDPDATGVLVLCINKATKALQFLQADNKEYVATLSLGQSTDTYDASGKVLEEKEFNGYDHLQDVINSFIGDIKQVPPMYSAIKINGKKLYDYARNNEIVEVPPRDVHIDSIKILKEEGNTITFKVKCSKGTYIRSLCKDLANALGYPGHMSKLERIQSGNFNIHQSISIDDLKNNNIRLISLEDAFSDMDKLVVDEKIVIHGKKIKSDINKNVAIYSKEGKLLAIYGPNGNGELKSLRGLF